MKHQKKEIYYGLTLNYKKNKNRNSVKWSKLITQQPKNLENSNIVVIKLGTIEHPKPFRKLSIAIRKAEKVSQASETGKNSDIPLYSEKKIIFF